MNEISQNVVEERPIPEVTHFTGALFIDDKDRMLLLKKAPGGKFGEKWSLPGGKDKIKEPRVLTLNDSDFRREIEEELGSEAVLVLKKARYLGRDLDEATIRYGEGMPIKHDRNHYEYPHYTHHAILALNVPHFKPTLSPEHTSYVWINPEDSSFQTIYQESTSITQGLVAIYLLRTVMTPTGAINFEKISKMTGENIDRLRYLFDLDSMEPF